VITPRGVRLVRVADLRTLHRTLAGLLPGDPFSARDCAVIVPSHGAAEQLRTTLENVALLDGPVRALAIPDLLTRRDFYVRLAQRLPEAPPLLDDLAREVLLAKAIREASESGAAAPFHVRPGHVVEILRLYDELRRRHKTVADFERLLIGSLEPSASHDRGAERLLQQTVFLVAAFRRFEEAVADSGCADEHATRALALTTDQPIYRHVVVAVADQAGDIHGLWSADFDLLSRMPHLDRIEIVATEAVLATGFHQRLHDLMPGIEEERVIGGEQAPLLVVPPGAANGTPLHAFIYRDREEELAGVVRAIREESDVGRRLDHFAVVFQRPLPYLYLARQVFADGGVSYQALDALPLAAEPFAAAIDLIFTAVTAGFTRAALLELLRSPHFAFGLEPSDIAALDRHLVERKYLGQADRLEALADEAAADDELKRVRQALAVAASTARELVVAFAASSAPDQLAAIVRFVEACEVQPRERDEWYARHRRARAAVLSAFEMLRTAHATHDPAPLIPADLAGVLRRWIEAQTFSPRLGRNGVALMDATAAPFADVEDVRIVGLVETDWPERGNRNIFYPQSLLTQLGWPAEQDRLSAARARFQDLLRLGRRRVALSTFHLEEDALVAPTSLLDEIATSGLRLEVVRPSSPRRVFEHEGLMIEPVVAAAASELARPWLELRLTRACDDPRYHGFAGPQPPKPYAVSHVERYLDCPFKYFAANVLKLPEERDEEAWMTPQERGQFVHEVFFDFFSEWQKRGQGAVTTGNVREAVMLFEEIAEERLARLGEGDRALERTLLLGSAAAPGLAERAFAFEIEHAVPVVERLLEHELQDTFEFSTGTATKRIAIRAKADRIDLLADGTLRIIDYKLGRAPKTDRSLQLPVYGACSAQALEGRHGRSWSASRAGYVAFREKQAFVALGRSREELEKAMAEGQERLCAAVDGIERGAFPVQPEDPYRCTWCAYPDVCRKDYVGDE
jgi:RecB family exonuclease